jgi:lipoprotein-anchoring transpeptidase ErfK/SrfK
MIKKKLFLFSLTGLIIFTLAMPSKALAQDEPTPESPDIVEPYEGLPLCEPGVYFISPNDCLPLGPSATLTQWARRGMILPLRPLPVSHPNLTYTELDQKYAKLNLLPGVQASFFPNLDAAIANWGALSTLPIGQTLYITYKSVSYYDNNPYVTNERGEWIRASPTTYSTFQGLLFKHQPLNNFGWIIDAVSPYREPSINAKRVNLGLNRGDVVQVYDKVEAEGTFWYMIKPGQWVDRNKIRVVSPSLTAPDGVDNGRWIEINLFEQTMTVYEDNHLVFATLVATGYEPYYTQPGLFQIREKKEIETMTGAFATGKTDYYLLENVPWTIYYDGPRALHGAYWRAMFGYEQSHGCVNLSVGDSHWLFDWSEVGDWVYVWDPSGKTPTDPEFYKGSAAF